MNPREIFKRECDVFASYLLGVSPTAFVQGKYAGAHRISTRLTGESAFDEFLVRVASRHRLLVRAADAWARVFAPGSLLRRKLILLLAILETCPRTGAEIDALPAQGKPRLFASVGVSLAASAASLVFGMLLFEPVRLWMAGRAKVASGMRVARAGRGSAAIGRIPDDVVAETPGIVP